MMVQRILRPLMRKKPVAVGLSDTSLARVLTTLDLTALGIGSTLGVGVYVLAGFVSKDQAGPAVILSFLIAAIASAFAGLCYAEFGARVPRAGSAYVYSYVTVGEFIAFIIGWNLILEYVIGAASVVRGLSAYIDALLQNVMKNAFMEIMPMNVSFLSTYPDFFACGVTILFSVALAFGVKESSTVNNIFTVINLTVVLFVIIAGSFKADPNNWKIEKENIPAEVDGGEGGFLPFGVSGVLRGAATCFYGFIGFDCVATTGEEAKNPQKSIPFAIITSLTVIFFAYFGVSTVLTMMWPYYAQDSSAPLPYVFEQIGWPVAKWIVSIGAIFGLFASLMGALYPLPRVIYAMASDGLLFEFMGRIHSRFHTPFVGTLFAGTLTGLMALLFDLDQLANMMSIGTLLAYSIVAACVLLLRYEVEDPEEVPLKAKRVFGEKNVEPQTVTGSKRTTLQQITTVVSQVFNLRRLKKPTSLTSKLVTWEVVFYCLFCFGATSCIVLAGEHITRGEPLAIAGVAVFFSGIILILLSISLQPTSSRELSFKVPLVPILPGVSILINIYLMMMLDQQTWLRFAIWIVIGLAIYFAYGIWHSTERVLKKPSSVKSVYGGIDNPAFNNNNDAIQSIQQTAEP